MTGKEAGMTRKTTMTMTLMMTTMTMTKKPLPIQAGRWIPAFAGMTGKEAGMTEKDAGTTRRRFFPARGGGRRRGP